MQAAWLVAVLAPAVVPESVRPETLGAVMVNALLPLKVACGLLYLASLPVLMQLLPAAAPQRRTVLSAPPDARVLPSGAKAR